MCDKNKKNLETYMKYLLIIILAATTSFGKTIKDGDTEYQCTPVKTCDEKLKTAYAEIARLKKQLKQTTVITKVETVEKVTEVTKIKKHIVSVIGHKVVLDVRTKTNNTGSSVSADTTVETGYAPAVTYQYQAENGLVPLIGIDLNKMSGILFGLGFEF